MIKKNITAYSTLAEQFDLMMDEPLKKYTSFKIGGPADLLSMPKDKQELKRVLNQAIKLNIPVTLFGGGTNLLVSDKGIRGLVVMMKHLQSDIRIMAEDLHETTLYVEAGNRLSSVCQFAINHSLSGLEFAAGIPGTLGGAIVMNAGTRSGTVSDIVDTLEVLNPDTLEFETIEKKALDFSYRHLVLPGTIVAATLQLKKADQAVIEKTFKQNLIKKNATQPVSAASAGCFFKNPAHGKPAGELIEKSGLKGMRINDAMVSDIHANYIVNVNNATCEDVLLLKRHIQETVFKKYQIQLETEVRMEGE